MAQTFTDLQGEKITIVENETEVRTDTDIVTGEVSRYIIEVYETPYEVDEDTYNAVKKYLKK